MQLLHNCTTSENRSRRDPTIICCEIFSLLITSLTELPSKFLEIRTGHDLSGLLQGKKGKVTKERIDENMMTETRRSVSTNVFRSFWRWIDSTDGHGLICGRWIRFREVCCCSPGALAGAEGTDSKERSHDDRQRSIVSTPIPRIWSQISISPRMSGF